MLAERAIDVSYDTIHRWDLVFGPVIAANIRTGPVHHSRTGHLGEVYARITGKRTYLWRAVDENAECGGSDHPDRCSIFCLFAMP